VSVRSSHNEDEVSARWLHTHVYGPISALFTCIYPEDGGSTLLRNVGDYQSTRRLGSRKHAFSRREYIKRLACML